LQEGYRRIIAIGREGFALYSGETIRGGAGLELGASISLTVYLKCTT
jgi:hypothetical protein